MSLDTKQALLANRSALVVDDTPFVRQLLAWQLQRVGFARVDLASNGEEAWSSLENHVPDVVFTDYHMPKMDGVTLVGKIRSSETYGKVPVVVVTTETRLEKEWRTVGFSDYMSKPYTNGLLEQTLDRVIGHCA